MDYYIHKLGNNPSNLLLYTVKNIENLTELVLNNDLMLAKSWGKKFACELLDECIIHSVDLETVLFIEKHFEITVKEFKEYYNISYSKHYYITTNILWNDNYELYNYLYSNVAGMLRIWNTDTGALVKSIDISTNLAFTYLKNGNLATGSSNKIQIWN